MECILPFCDILESKFKCEALEYNSQPWKTWHRRLTKFHDDIKKLLYGPEEKGKSVGCLKVAISCLKTMEVCKAQRGELTGQAESPRADFKQTVKSTSQDEESRIKLPRLPQDEIKIYN